MRSLVVDSSCALVSAVLTNLPATAKQFVDFGCGRGEVLVAVAERFPETECIGIDTDLSALSVAATRILDKALKNVELIEGDVIDYASLSTEVAYMYLGGALNQRLGHYLLDETRPCKRIIAARYPIVSAVPSSHWETGDDSRIYVYDKPGFLTLVEWDYCATELIAPAGSAYLLSRAVRVGVEAELSLVVTTRGGNATVAAFEFGQCPSRPGVPIVVDLLIRVPAGLPTVLEIAITADGEALSPMHSVITHPAETAAGGPLERPLTKVEMASVTGIATEARR